MKKSRASRSPYIPPAARGGTSSGSTTSNKGSIVGILDTNQQQQDSTKHEGGGSAVGSGGKGSTEIGRGGSEQRKPRSRDCAAHQRPALASTASSSTATPTATIVAAAAVVHEEDDPNEATTHENVCEVKFNRQCSVESRDDEKSSSAHQAAEVAVDFEAEGSSKGQSRRKAPRKAWSQYVPPGRRVAEGDDNKAPSNTTPMLQSQSASRSSAPRRQPALTTTTTTTTTVVAERLPKSALSPGTDASDAQQDGLQEGKDPAVQHAEGEHQGTPVSSMAAVQTTTTVVVVAAPDCTAESMLAHDEGTHDEVANKDNVSPEIKHPATEPRALLYGLLPEGRPDDALPLHAPPSSMLDGACCCAADDDKGDTSDAGIVDGARSSRPAQQHLSGSEPVVAGAELVVPETGIIANTPPISTSCYSEGMTRDREHNMLESSAGPYSAATDTEPGTSGPSNSHSGHYVAAAVETRLLINSSSTESRDDTATGQGETQAQPTTTTTTKTTTTFERYVPPGRRKLIEGALAAGNDGGTAVDGAAATGMGPLWTSRAPVRVSQRARPSDREATSPSRPAPARVAGAVSGGMSAYGANISAYSEHMSRDQVERCTAYITNFPASLPPGQREPMLQSFVALGALIVWPRPDEALATFATPALARQAVSSRTNRSTVLVVELLSEAREEKRAALKRVELARPGRPPADVSSATRLISGALGIRRPRAKPTASPIRQSATASSGTVRIRGRGAKTAQQQQQPAEATDSWDM